MAREQLDMTCPICGRESACSNCEQRGRAAEDVATDPARMREERDHYREKLREAETACVAMRQAVTRALAAIPYNCTVKLPPRSDLSAIGYKDVNDALASDVGVLLMVEIEALRRVEQEAQRVADSHHIECAEPGCRCRHAPREPLRDALAALDAVRGGKSW